MKPNLLSLKFLICFNSLARYRENFKLSLILKYLKLNKVFSNNKLPLGDTKKSIKYLIVSLTIVLCLAVSINIVYWHWHSRLIVIFLHKTTAIIFGFSVWKFSFISSWFLIILAWISESWSQFHSTLWNYWFPYHPPSRRLWIYTFTAIKLHSRKK